MRCRRQIFGIAVTPLGLSLVAVLGLCALQPEGAGAQTAWDSPLLLAPSTPAGVGFFLLDPHPRNALAAMVTYRARRTPGGMGLRFGVAEEVFDDIAIFGGADFTGPLLDATEEFPLDIIWVAGVGASFSGDLFEVGFPLGISLGRVFDTESARFVPYLSPRIVLDGKFGGNDDEGIGTDNLGVEMAIDLGIDFAFSNRATLRFAAGIGDRDGLAIGLNLGRVR